MADLFWTVLSVLAILGGVLVTLWIGTLLIFLWLMKRYKEEVEKFMDDSVWYALDPDSREN